jgi:chromosome partitioning protein
MNTPTNEPCIVALAGQKGGSGKTTTAICLADEWHRRGNRVLLVDTDPQATSRTWGDLNTELDKDGPTVIGMGPGFHEKLDQFLPNFDYVVIDVPPGHGEIQRAALMVANLAIIPCAPGATDIWSMAETIDLSRKARSIRNDLFVGILMTRKDARAAIGDHAREALESTELPVLDSALGFRVAYQEAPGAGLGVTRYDPGSSAAKEVQTLTDELEAIFHSTSQPAKEAL